MMGVNGVERLDGHVVAHLRRQLPVRPIAITDQMISPQTRMPTANAATHVLPGVTARLPAQRSAPAAPDSELVRRSRSRPQPAR